MNVFELALAIAVLAAGWFTGSALYPRYGVAGAVAGGLAGSGLAVAGWVAVSYILDRRRGSV
jgi:hypothetical protein